MEMEGREIILFNDYLPEEIQTLILMPFILEYCYDSGHAGELGSVCKNWYKFIKANHPSNLPFYTIPHNMEESCWLRIFYNGALTYTRNDGRIVRLPFSALNDPFHGTFDLSDCDDAGTYLVISTGWRTRVNPENTNKIEIFICLRNLIMVAHRRSVSHYESCLLEWPINAQVGIFWNLGCWNCLGDYCYLTSKDFSCLSSADLLKLYFSSTLLRGQLRQGEYHYIPKYNQMNIGKTKNIVCLF